MTWINTTAIAVGMFAAVALLGCSRTPQTEKQLTEATAPHEQALEFESVTLSEEAVARAGIEVGQVEKHILTPTIHAPARIAFNQEAFAHVGTPVPGRVIEINVRLGDVVAAKDVLLVVESPELGAAQSDYLQKRASIGGAKSALRTARLAFERGQAVYKEGQGIALAEVQRRESEYQAAKSQLENAESALRAAAQKLQSLGMDAEAISVLERFGELSGSQSILAPIAGTVIQREVTIGELVVPDKETLIMLADMSKLWVIVDVPEAQFRRVTPGARAWINVGAVSDATLEGIVSVVSPSLNAATRSVEARIEVASGTSRLSPGMFAQVEIEDRQTASSEPLVAVPKSAVQSIDQQVVVFTPSDDRPNTFIEREIKVGEEVGGMLPVLSGVEVGDRIVTHGAFILKAELGKDQTGDED